MNTSSFVSVVIAAFNAARTLPAQLEALANQTYRGPWELIVADNGSSDDTRVILDAWTDKLTLRVVDAFDRKGPNHARNVGARAARGDLLLFCDADDVAAPGWIEAMVEAAGSSDLLGGCLDHEALNPPDVRSWRPTGQRDGLSRSLGFLPYVKTANCAVRTAVFQELGGWNEGFAHGGDDVEFSWRAQLASYSLSFVPDAVVHYRHRQGLRNLARQYYEFGIGATRLYRDFRTLVPKKRIRGGLRMWLWILSHAPHALLFSDKRPRFVRKTAYRAGLFRGSIRHRVLCL